MNSFEVLEQEYLLEYQKTKGKKVWTLGPFSLLMTRLTGEVSPLATVRIISDGLV